MNTVAREIVWGSILALGVATSVASAPMAVAVTDPVVTNCATYPYEQVVRPDKLLLACGDAGLWVKDIHWTSWGPDTAEGEATQLRKTCQPDCATGGVATGPTHITLRKVVQPGNRFSEAEIIDLNGTPETWPL
ncbi:hypothetical protein JK358_05460 [Nocardia sp. 2]|uniref:Secreted protein n=1 Tax=Nocardia acididurans TaxID=2802282 RepID=A0ABS1M0W6_9NOCA|nr:hypothetical protein [Nocardia acididurans]MBL1073834.1 hypothetical protein [Nocardia acididurans]